MHDNYQSNDTCFQKVIIMLEPHPSGECSPGKWELLDSNTALNQGCNFCGKLLALPRDQRHIDVFISAFRG